MTTSAIQNPQSETSESTQSRLSRSDHPAVRHYMLFCLSALFLLVVCLADRGMEWWCLVPALIGCLTLLTNWSHGPPLVLLSLAGLLGMAGPRSHGTNAGWSQFQTPTLMDLVLCIAVLAYVLGHYRILSLMRNIFPPDPRGPHSDASQRRSPDLVTGRETALLGLALPLWTGLALMVWATGKLDLTTPFGIRYDPWWLAPLDFLRELGLVWAVLAVIAAVGIAANYLRRTTATPEESLLYLQDQCWRLTRREQGILNRWLTWARLRAQRKKEAS
ncbi:MAG TPA: hypothetical protein VMF69_21450 [Gemmataceae bacterium]|nr:hypothetical protein [Gemmataceae bacterium]